MGVAALWVHEITLAPRPESVATARRFVREKLVAHRPVVPRGRRHAGGERADDQRRQARRHARSP